MSLSQTEILFYLARLNAHNWALSAAGENALNIYVSSFFRNSHPTCIWWDGECIKGWREIARNGWRENARNKPASGAMGKVLCSQHLSHVATHLFISTNFNEFFISMEDEMYTGISYKGTGIRWTPHCMFVYRCLCFSSQSTCVSWTLRRGKSVIWQWYIKRMWINTIRKGLFDKYKIINQLQIHCSVVWHVELPTCRVVWIPANLGKIWLLRLCELVKCFTGFRGD